MGCCKLQRGKTNIGMELNMKGYIYPMYAGADPAFGWIMNDPIFSRVPTLGACMPNIRRAVNIGDYIFCISGRIPDVKPYVVGGFRVAEKIDALAAYHRLPENRLARAENGQITGNIIVDANGKHNALDHHAAFERRIENYVIGDQSVFLESAASIDYAREQTLPMLSKIFAKDANRVFDIVNRWRRLDENQIGRLYDWLLDVRG